MDQQDDAKPETVKAYEALLAEVHPKAIAFINEAFSGRDVSSARVLIELCKWVLICQYSLDQQKEYNLRNNSQTSADAMQSMGALGQAMLEKLAGKKAASEEFEADPFG